jgi:hypothetical protein
MSSTEAAKSVALPLPRAVDEALASDIEKQSVYVSEELQSLKVDSNRHSVTIVLKPGADSDRVVEKASRYLEAMLRRFRRIEPTVHYRRPRAAQAPLERQVFQRLIERGWAHQHSQGVVSLSDTALELLNAIDDTFDRAYRQRYSARARSYPAMVKASLLARCGYFEMHPNALSFVSHLKNDFDEIEDFRRANAGSLELKTTHAGAFAPVHHCLNPAACFPCYENLENQAVAPTGQVLTWRGRVFRYESSNTVGLDRLREFNVRELVFIGTDSFVQSRRLDAVNLTIALMEEWDLTGRIETATDPFFATVYAAKTFWQQSTEVKFEVCLDIEPDAAGNDRTIAAGSLNLHGAFFGDRFNIRDHEGAPAYSGCVGWGLERWVLAIFTQHGLDTAKWPAALRTHLS